MPEAPSERRSLLRRAWLATGAGLLLVVAGMTVVPSAPQGSVPWLVGALLLLVGGLVALVVGIVWSARALRRTQSMTAVPLLLACLALPFCLIALLGAFGRFNGWDG